MAKEFTITRVFDAPREKVWEAWTNPDQAKKWWGPKDFTAPSIESDFKVGGKYLYCMRGAITPGGELKDFWSTGQFLEIMPMEKIVATDSFADEKGNVVPASHYGMGSDWAIERTVTATFEDTGDGKTKFTIYYPDVSDMKEKDVEDMRQGWGQSLDKLEKIL